MLKKLWGGWRRAWLNVCSCEQMTWYIYSALIAISVGNTDPCVTRVSKSRTASGKNVNSLKCPLCLVHTTYDWPHTVKQKGEELITEILFSERLPCPPQYKIFISVCCSMKVPQITATGVDLDHTVRVSIHFFSKQARETLLARQASGNSHCPNIHYSYTHPHGTKGKDQNRGLSN